MATIYRVIKKSNGNDCAPPREIQILYREETWFFGVWSRVELDREEIPAYEIAARPIGGAGWVSKFAPFDECGILPRNHPMCR
jgi:hypothetical protein